MNFLTKERIKKAGIEIISMIVAVLIALAANSWWLDNVMENQAEAAVAELNIELKHNYEATLNLIEEVTIRKEKLDSIKSMIDNSEGFYDYIKYFKGYRFTNFEKSAWARLTDSDFTNLVDSDYRKEAFSIYSSIKNLDELFQKINDIALTEVLYNPEKAKYAYMISMQFMRQELVWAKILKSKLENFKSKYDLAKEKH